MVSVLKDRRSCLGEGREREEALKCIGGGGVKACWG